VATLKKFNLSGKEIGEVIIDDAFLDAEANGQMIKDYIVALRANARQWSASTKTRGEVAHTTKKPHPQKGTGRARQGTLVAPQHRGGGRAHGPRPKFDQHVRINKKERRAAIRFLLAEKIKENQVSILDEMSLKKPKTKSVASFLGARETNKRVLFLGDADENQRHGQDHFRMSVRNLPSSEFRPATQVSGYDLLVARHLVVTEAGLQEMIQWLS
jgi:large subunit ribosomal protein L4